MSTLAFWTTGENMTKILRDLWEEGSCKHAFRTAKEGLGMVNEQALEMFEGKMKLEGSTKEGDHTLGFIEDSYKGRSLNELFEFHTKHYVDLYINYYGYDSKVRTSMIRALDKGDGFGIGSAENDMKTIISIEKKKLDYLKELIFLCEISKHNIDEVYEKLFKEMVTIEESQVKEKARELIAEHEKEVQKKTLDTFIEKQHRMDIAPITIGKVGSSNFGWINLKGVFYTCEYMGHIGLTQKLFDDKLAPGPDEKDLEKVGWLKLTDNAFLYSSLSKLTKKQQDFIMEHQMENEMKSIEFNGSLYETFDELLEENIGF